MKHATVEDNLFQTAEAYIRLKIAFRMLETAKSYWLDS